ncbi:MAG: glycine cleavage system aminomethyltransferase GcvT [Solirubrobacterales bacterium]
MSLVDLRQTPLVDRHRAAGGNLVPFAGWEMPVEYAGVSAEHQAVRTDVGIFDVSHMGEVLTTGPDAAALLQRVVTNDIDKLATGGAQYSCLLREDGGVLDDLFTYKLGGDRYLTVTNAANHERDFEWMRTHADGFDAEVTDVADRYAMVAVQGPRARSVVAEHASAELPARMRTAEMQVGGADALVCGTGYTGEDGLEVLVAPEDAGVVWGLLAGSGATPCGLASRDTLRLEVCFHLYGNDLSTERTPIAGGLGWCCKEQTGFIGAEAVELERADGPRDTLVPFVITARGIPRPGNPVIAGDEVAGEVTSGTHSPSLGVGIGMAYVRPDLAEPGTEFEIDVRGKRRAAQAREKPLYSPDD